MPQISGETSYTAYVVRNVVNGSLYVGITSTTPKSRWAKHVNSAKCGSDYALHRAIRSHGQAAFVITTIASGLTFADANELEQRTIEELNTKVGNGRGYNMTAGGRGFRRAHSEVSKARISESCERRYRENPEAVERIRQQKLSHFANPRNRMRAREYHLSHARAVIQQGSSGIAVARFTSASEASRVTRIDRSDIAKTCNRERRSAGGFIWRFAEND
jgi:group I intron endonuclease